MSEHTDRVEEKMKPLYELLHPGEIRLLSVWPPLEADNYSKNGEHIQCSLITVRRIDVGGQYDALSYVWGDSTVTRAVIVNEHQLDVTENLYKLLREWRRRCIDNEAAGFSNRPLWIDAVCINQGDVEEKSSQVQQMGDTYRSAARTLSWLGEATPFSSTAMSALDEMAHEISRLPVGADPLSWLREDQTHLWGHDCDRETCQTHRHLLFSTTNHIWNCIMEFFEIDYWSRSWILQELSLCREASLWCGYDAILLSSVLEVIGWRERTAGRVHPSFATEMLWRSLQSARLLNTTYLENIRTIKETLVNYDEVPGNVSRWSQFVTAAKNLAATDPRDKVYSVLGMANIAVKPDYSASVETVYTEFARFSGLSSRNLSFLEFSGLGILPVRTEALLSKSLEVHHLFVPSWVPNWDSLKVIGTFGLLRSFDWRADGGFGGGSAVQFTQHTLQTRGMTVDSAVTSQSLAKDDLIGFCREYLHATSPEYSRGQALLRLLYLDRDLPSRLRYHEIGDKSEYHHNSFLSMSFVLGCVEQIPVESVIRSLGFDSSMDVCPYFFDWKPDEIRNRFQDLFENSDERLASWGENFYIDLALQIPRLIAGYNVFTTTDGRIGWGPPRMEVGDLVCVIFGYGLLAVLRRVGSDIYHYVGPCFVVGIMAGEAVEGIDMDSDRIQSFCLV